jgi:hypothetical protein
LVLDQVAAIDAERSLHSYYQAYKLIRSITGFASGKGPIILVHDTFLPIASFGGFLSGADRIGVDREWGKESPSTGENYRQTEASGPKC